MNEMMSPVAAAVEPLRSAAVERAKIEGRKLAEIYLAKFAVDPTLADYPRNTGRMSKFEYQRAKSTYNLIQSLTTSTNSYDRRLPKPIPTPDPVKIERFVTECGERAQAEYTAFVMKLEEKIGAHDSATLEGDHVWSYSTLTVVKGDIVERWTTHQILNVSKLGKIFNQWPTRKVKRNTKG